MQDIQSIRSTLERWLYPDLARVAPHNRTRALQRARSESFDFLEVCGLVTAMGVVAYLTRYAVKDPSIADRLSAAVANFVIAIPQLFILASPFLVRRTRRGLRAFLIEQDRA